MAALCSDFELWLADKLRTLNIDPDVFGSYITGILEGTETEEEKSEALQGILSEVCEDGISEVKDEIFNKWSAYIQSPAEGGVRADDEGKYNVEAKLVSLMEEQAKSVVPEKSVTVEEQKLRQAILAQYAEISDGEEESGPVPKAAAVPETVSATASTGAPHKEHYASKLLARNTNAETVAHAEKEKREMSKQEHERKKAQDKLNREKQKQQQQDRKDKERKRTQKGERRR